MYISYETPEQVDLRLRSVVALTSFAVLEGDWWFDEFPLAALAQRTRADAVALVRDRDCWSQLVPVLAEDQPIERLRVWCCHFPPGVDNSGFIGWLASRIKHKVGSGIFVVCGQNSERGGIYDYAGCPLAVADAVLAELRLVFSGGVDTQVGTRGELLDGVSMRVAATASSGEVNSDTLFAFTQHGQTVSARYSGGPVRLGHLVGTLSARQLTFRYAQVNLGGRVDGGVSSCEVQTLPDGRIQLHEHFQWESRSGSGHNVLEQVVE